MRQTFVMRDGELVLKHKERTASAHVVMPDIAEFVTQDGTEITSRSGLRAYEQRTGSRQLGNDWPGSEKPKGWDR